MKTERQIIIEVLNCYKDNLGVIDSYKFNSVALDIINELCASQLPVVTDEEETESILEPIQNALYATRRLSQDNCIDLSVGILEYIRDAGFKVVRNSLIPSSGNTVKEEVPVLSDLSESDKASTIDQFVRLTAKHTLQLFMMLGLKSHIDAKVTNDATGDIFEFSFKKIISSAPDIKQGEGELTRDEIEDEEWHDIHDEMNESKRIGEID
jgi:hypothetical protein